MAQRDPFSRGEQAVMAALAKGLRPGAIARELSVHIRFVQATLLGLRLRYGAKNHAELIECIERGAPIVLPHASATATAKLQARRLPFSDEALQAWLGSERPDVTCRREGCHSGAILHSMFCRMHHVDMLRRASGTGPE